MNNKAFTLAEVLITLGIICVVAAMTLPTLINKNNNKVVETKLSKFYSVINQTIQRSEADNGDKKIWHQFENNVPVDNEGNPIPGQSLVEKWVNRYLAPYFKITHIKYDSKGLPIFYLADGLIFKPDQTNTMNDWVFYTMTPEKCISRAGSENKAYGKCAFRFMYKPVDTTPEMVYHYNRGFEPYKYQWNGKTNSLKTGIGGRFGCKSNCNTQYCNWYCTALIQTNGWKIPKDYPYNVYY